MKLKEQASKDKLRGGFYTPLSIAKFILRWGLVSTNESEILEPSCGDGNFINALKELELPFDNLTAIEFDETEYYKARNVALENTIVLNEDFHNFCVNTNRRFDLVVGNPPYIRYQFFEKEQQELAIQIFNRSGLKYSKLTNAWVSFVVGASQLLKETGKIGFVLPAEILQVSYAKQLRTFLASEFNKINIISFQKLVFPDIQQEVVILLCEKDNSNFHRIDHIELYDEEGLERLDLAILDTPQKNVDFHSNKWTYYFLEQEEIDFLENIAETRNISTLGNFAKVEVGITTGANPYFTISRSIVEEYGLQDYVVPMVGRSVQVQSIRFTIEDWNLNYQNEKIRSSLVTFPQVPFDKLNIGGQAYVRFGEDNAVNKGYKTGIRDFWYCVPSLRTSSALFIRRNNHYPKLIVNEANAYTTDTMHRVSVKEGISINALVASYYNSLSFAFAEVSGRSHGGGVLELMPNEAENILLPYSVQNENLLQNIDNMMRAGQNIEQILEFTNQIILRDSYNLTDHEINIANSIWRKLKNRRLSRN
ncbi:class I SAM-dependent methyltransferase [Chryseobacterium sp.]|uniref:class I SAM-dependent methyltransferase n=1 Tax=Chryseobacterium sp. TaxID=1871047 RepID=UPI0023F64C16|nr:class I SAM-dependent methyltransferase [Chryseobacterium sp.]